MTVSEAIMEVDKLRPNAYSEDVKVRWLSELDGKIALEVCKSKDVPLYKYPNDCDRELLVAHPHSDIYPLYLVAMIDFYNQDIGSYQNVMSMFNNNYDIFAKWYQRTQVPKSNGGFKNFFD